jgi:hypothetical protein
MVAITQIREGYTCVLIDEGFVAIFNICALELYQILKNNNTAKIVFLI